MRVLAAVSHPDDEVLGPGATLAKHSLAHDDVRVLILGMGRGWRQTSAAKTVADVLGVSVAVRDFPDNQFDTVPLLSIVQMIEGEIAEHKPEVVYTHSLADLNVDHRVTHEAVRAACRPVNGCTVKRILAFETPSSTEWGMGTFAPTVFVDVSGAPFAKKGRALAHYESEMRPAPHPRSFQAIEALATWRGAQAGVDRAEAFEVIRWVLS